MELKLYVFPLTEKEALTPNITGFKLIMDNPDRVIEAPVMDTGISGLNNYDMGRNLVVYNNKVYEIFKDYTDVTNNKRYYMLRPLTRGADLMT